MAEETLKNHLTTSLGATYFKYTIITAFYKNEMSPHTMPKDFLLSHLRGKTAEVFPKWCQSTCDHTKAKFLGKLVSAIKPKTIKSVSD